MAKSREIEVFGLSFMDLISCALGGMLVIMIVFSTLVRTQGVALPASAKAAGKSLAQYEREQSFSTYFILIFRFKTENTKIIPQDRGDLVYTQGQTKLNNGDIEHLLIIYRINEMANLMKFKLTNYAGGGTVKLSGDVNEVEIPIDKTIIVIEKEKAKYRLKI